MKKIVLFLALASVLVLAGCTNGQPGASNQNSNGDTVQQDGTIVKPDGTMVKPDGTMVKPDGTMVKPDGTMILPDGTMVEPNDSGSPGTSRTLGSLYQPFSKAEYEAAKASGKKIFLDFYANWCPICKAQEPNVEGAFSDWQNAEIVGFRVNYNDSQTDSDEQALARQFNVTYQHTYVFVDSSEEVLLRQSGATWGASEIRNKLTAAAS